MSPVERRTRLLYRQTAEQQRLYRVQTVSFIIFCIFIVVAGAYRAGHHTSKASAHEAGIQASATSSSPLPQPAPAPITGQDSQLTALVTAWSRRYSFTSTVDIRELTGAQRRASLNSDSKIVTASTFKLYVAYAVLHGIEQGNYTLSTVTSDGNTISSDMSSMILNSDNDAARTLGFMIGWPQIDSLLASQGMTHTDTNNYIGSSTTAVGDKYSTAADLSLLLQKLYAGQLLTASHTQYLLNLLEHQNYRSGIPAGTPSGTTVADKPGWLTPADGIYEYIQNDVGIVYGPKSSYVIVVTTTGKSMAPIATLSQQVYSYLEN